MPGKKTIFGAPATPACLARLALCAGTLLWAAMPAQAREIYSLPQLTELAQEQHPRLRAAAEGVNGAAAAIDTARAYPNPELEWVNGSQRARIPSAVAGNTHGLTLAQRLDLPGQRNARINAATAGLSAEQAQLRLSRQELVRMVKLRYYDVLRRESELDAAEQDLKTSEQVRERVSVRVSTGEAPRYDIIRADAELLNAQKQAQSARLRVEQAKAALRNSVGNVLPPDFEVNAEIEPLPELPPLATLEAQVRERNAGLARARALTVRGREQLGLERALRTPAVTLRAGYDEDPEVRSTRFGVTVSIPLWDRRRGPVAEASAQLSRLQFEQEQAEFDLRQQLSNAYQQYQIGSNQVSALESGIIRQAEAALRVAEAAYRFGERGILDYLDAQRVYRSARNELIAARFERRAALIDIQTLNQE
jgi:cobalt-zinc-cadmium efflux system outer membrane protein